MEICYFFHVRKSEIMKLNLVFCPAIVFVTFLMATTSYGKWVWNKDTGWMQPPSGAVASLEQRFKSALYLLVEQKYINAIKEFELIINDYPDSEYAELSQIKIGWAYYLNGDYKRALKAYEKVLQEYPGTKRTKEVLEKEFQIGIAQMEIDEKAAIKVFEKIIENHPMGPIAPDAQIKIADSYFKLGYYEEATEAYEKFLENYPRNEWIPYVQYQIPLSKVYFERQQERNYGLLVSAREDFEKYLITNPHGVHVEDARKMIKEIKNIEAEREFEIGEFYLRRKTPSSAAMYFGYVIKDYPDTIWAQRAKERLEFLRMIEAIK
ncbi:MAG: outer membrane protein assembly factor BamD [Candidatus Kuenenia sp.]|nr:outer membrane protein assembly factor BamD [Candidatus Kuenenia hertensis]